MKIAVDGFELGREAKGVGRVVQNLMAELPRLMPDDRFLIFTKERVGGYGGPGTEEHPLPWRGGYLRWLNGPLRRALKKAKPDLLIASNYILPWHCPWRSILIEHDISVISHPEWYPLRYALTRRYLVRRSLERAGRVVVPSAFIGEEIRTAFGIKSDKIKPIGWGIEDAFRRAPEDEARGWRDRRGLAGKKVVGFLGSIFKRRHVPELIRAVGLLREEIPEAVLHLVGEDFGALTGGGFSLPTLPDWVLWEKSLPEEELPLFYSSIEAFAYLSEYEGFGFPPLEAMACGTPSVLLAGSSLKEIYSGLAFMVDTPDPGTIAAALKTALADERRRAALLEEFERRRDRFSWKRTAGELAVLIRSMG